MSESVENSSEVIFLTPLDSARRMCLGLEGRDWGDDSSGDIVAASSLSADVGDFRGPEPAPDALLLPLPVSGSDVWAEDLPPRSSEDGSKLAVVPWVALLLCPVPEVEGPVQEECEATTPETELDVVVV